MCLIFCWPMITYIRYALNQIHVIFEDPITTSYYRSLLEIDGLLFTAVTEGLVGRRCTLLTMLTSSTVTFFLISFYYPEITVFHKFLVFFANLPTTTANTLIVLFTLCVFPTCLSSVTIGQCSSHLAVDTRVTQVSSPRSLAWERWSAP